MNSIELENIAKKLKLEDFLGVFAVDELMQIPPKKCGMLIYNTDTSEKKGQHWIALCISKEDVFYFDSLNHGFIFISDAAKFFIKLKKNLFYNKIKTQTNESNTCGIHCMVFCSYMSSDISKERFSSFLNSYIPLNIKERDNMTILYMSSLRQ